MCAESTCRHFVAVALERTMRLSFRDFHLQFDPTLRRERVPEAMFELLGPTPLAKPVFEGPPVAAAQQGEQEMADAEQPADAPAAAQPNGTASAEASAVASADVAAAEVTAEPAAGADAAANGTDELEPVPDLARQLFEQVTACEHAAAAAWRVDSSPAATHAPGASCLAQMRCSMSLL